MPGVSGYLGNGGNPFGDFLGAEPVACAGDRRSGRAAAPELGDGTKDGNPFGNFASAEPAKGCNPFAGVGGAEVAAPGGGNPVSVGAAIVGALDSLSAEPAGEVRGGSPFGGDAGTEPAAEVEGYSPSGGVGGAVPATPSGTGEKPSGGFAGAGQTTDLGGSAGSSNPFAGLSGSEPAAPSGAGSGAGGTPFDR